MNNIIKWRRWFHEHPELSFSEYETSKFIKSLLDNWGIRWKAWGDTALVAEIGEGGHTIAIRTDMDALPIDEENDVPYRSLYPKRMHACGHDGHMAILLGLINEINQIKEELPGRVVFVFQPAEETGEGAKFLVEKGVIEYYGIERVIGFHLFSSILSGIIGAKAGIIMAEGDKISIKIKGKGAHGATPWLSSDVIALGSTVIQTIFSNILRHFSPLSEQIVFSIGKVHAGDAFNVIPQLMEIEGTLRSLSHERRDEFVEKLRRVIGDIVSSLGADAKIKIDPVFPPLINDESLYTLLKDVVANTNFAFKEVYPTTVSEDFSYFSQRVPGLYFFIGIKNEEKGIIYPHHHPKFDIDEDMLFPAVGLIRDLVLKIYHHML